MKSNNNKRTGALKELMRQEVNVRENSLVNLKEDLVSSDQSLDEANIKSLCSTGSHIIRTLGNTHQEQKSLRALLHKSDLSQSIALFKRLIVKELESTAIKLKIESEELQAWIDLQVEVPAKTILSLLRTAKETGLDPLREEIGFIQYEDGNWQVYISLEGAIKLLNSHPAFDGITFSQSETLIDGVPEWIECSIHRKDRSYPSIIREYYVESRGEQLVWGKMPRRMLRNRAIQQCARLALSSTHDAC